MLFGISLAFILPFVFAHQPVLVMDQTGYINGSFVINNPEISRAFYGELNGKPDFYIIDSNTNFNLYLQILSPYPDGKQDFSVAVYRNKTLYALIDGDSHFTWSKFYESFTGDNYWQGPESERQVSAGRYLIIVYNPENIGKYSLVVGNVESFPFNEQMKALVCVFRLKHDFFDKSYLAIFQGVMGKILLLLIAILIVLILLIIFFIRKIIRGRRDKKRRKFVRVRV